jgi:hypothetical protein
MIRVLGHPGTWIIRTLRNLYIYLLSGGERAPGWGCYLVTVAAGMLENRFLGLRRGCGGAAPGLWRIAAVRRDAAAGLRQNYVACDGVLWRPVASARIGWGGAVADVAELNRQQRAVGGCNGL